MNWPIVMQKRQLRENQYLFQFLILILTFYKKNSRGINAQWRSSVSIFLEIKNCVTKLVRQPGFNRRDEAVYNRLRAGHAHITHSYLMDSEIQGVPPACELCGVATITVNTSWLTVLLWPELEDIFMVRVLWLWVEYLVELSVSRPTTLLISV